MSNIEECNGGTAIIATVGDTFICLVYAGMVNDSDIGPGAYRPEYAYVVMQKGVLITSGQDLYGPVGAPYNMRSALSTLVSHALADADHYRATMNGSEAEEWAYQNDSELEELSLQLDDRD